MILIPPRPIDPGQLDAIVRIARGPGSALRGVDFEALVAGILYLWNRERELIEFNNASLAKTQHWESEANQAYAEQRLLRAECVRLRNANAALSRFVEECHARAGEYVPVWQFENWRQAFNCAALARDAVFPPDGSGECGGL